MSAPRANVLINAHLDDLLPAILRGSLLRLVCRDGIRIRLQAHVDPGSATLSRDVLVTQSVVLDGLIVQGQAYPNSTH